MSLDIVIPAHDEEARIGRTLHAYRNGIRAHDARFHIALDGCADRTADIVRTHMADDERVVLHEFPKLGKGGVLMETFRRCDADLIAFVDADCATPPAELDRLVAVASDADADGAIASRRLPASFTPGRRGSGRALTSRGFAWGIRRCFRLPYADTQCGAKVLSRRAAQRVVPLLSSRDFLFDVDLLLVADHLGFDVREVPTVWIDQAGSKIDVRREVRRMVAGAVRLWVHHRTLPVQPAVEAFTETLTDRTPTVTPTPAHREVVDAA